MFNFIRDLYRQGKIDRDDVLLYTKQGYLYPEEEEAILGTITIATKEQTTYGKHL